MQSHLISLLVIGCGLVIAGCSSTVLVEPERDLTREYEAEIRQLRSMAHEYCAEAGEGVETIEIRVKRTNGATLAQMIAACDTGKSMIRCTLTADAGAAPECFDTGG